MPLEDSPSGASFFGWLLDQRSRTRQLGSSVSSRPSVEVSPAMVEIGDRTVRRRRTQPHGDICFARRRPGTRVDRDDDVGHHVGVRVQYPMTAPHEVEKAPEAFPMSRTVIGRSVLVPDTIGQRPIHPIEPEAVRVENLGDLLSSHQLGETCDSVLVTVDSPSAGRYSSSGGELKPHRSSARGRETVPDPGRPRRC